MDFFEDNLARLKAARGGTASAVEPQAVEKIKKLGDHLDSEIQDKTKIQKILDYVIYPELRKLVTTTDLASIRTAPIADVGVFQNEHAPLLRLLETQPQGIFAMDDYQVTIPEERIGTSEIVAPWNITGDLPPELKMNRPVRTNTLTCVGQKIAVALITQEMARQQANIDQMRRELQFANTRIRVKMDKMLTVNTESKFEELPNVPQLGGFLTRSTLYGTGAGGGDLTKAILQGRVDAISNNASLEGRGYDVQLVGHTNARQLQVIRDIVVQDYNGIYPTDRLAFEEALARQLSDARIRSMVLFEANPGRVIPFMLNSNLPSGTTLLFEPSQPQLAKMRLGGSFGIFVMQRPTERLQELNVAFDLFSLVDPIVESRSVIDNHL